ALEAHAPSIPRIPESRSASSSRPYRFRCATEDRGFATGPGDSPWWRSRESEVCSARSHHTCNVNGDAGGCCGCMLESNFCLEFSRMPDENARQKAEDHYYAALDLMADGHLEKAVAAYQEALNADPTFTEAMHGLARALQDLQRYDEAIAVAQRLAEIDPDDVLAHTSLSVLYQKKGMIPEAEAEGAKARVLGWKQQLKKN